MGAKESKQSSINYEDAIKRVSETEFRRLKDAFKKSAGVGKLHLSQKSFYQDVLCEGVPTNIAELLYSACGGTAKGISFKDLLCGLVLLTRGTEEEKIRFLWNLYCNDAGTYIIKSEYTKAVNLYSHEIGALFVQGDRANFEQFHDWIKSYSSATVLSKWLFIDTCISLTSELESPTFYQSLAGVTHLEEKDIGDLEKEFWRLKNTSSSSQLDLNLVGPLISPPIPKNALEGLFNAFDENRDGHIDFKELCCGVSAACRGPTVERTRFCFKIFDIDRDGMLSHSETIQMINVLLFVAKENKNSIAYKDLTKKEVINDLLTFTARKCNQTENKSENFTAENISLTPEDFMMWSVESNLKLVQPFLDLVFEVCHIVFGLWPQCKHMEYDIVRGWLKREEKRQYRVGQFWYLISRDWWLTWLQYTQGNAATSCDYCKKSYCQKMYNVGAVDEAMVCDESFNSTSLEYVGDTINTADSYSLGSASSGVSSGRGSSFKPGPIDNTNLITIPSYKNVRTLTGEGGQLKRDTPLVQNHDFELIPKSLWKALNRWYSDILPLPRQVIQPPNATEVELELYPLNLRILLHQHVPSNLAANNWNVVSGSYGVIASGGGYAAMSTTNILQPPKRYLAYTAAFSGLATVRQIGTFLCDQLRLRIEDIRLWHIPSGSLDTTILLEEESMSLKELSIKDNDQVLLEIRNKDLTWPEELGSLALNQNTTAGDRRLTRSSVHSVHAPGATGLHNLGNTCFMNAALQVLFNTQPMAQYFHRNMHLFELNTSNKLGTRGQLATRYGEILKEVWTASTRSVAPLKLRFCVTKHAPQFAGGGQHDSQELLEWFLDALHEDLNRVTEKPYSELKDSNGRPDKLVASEAWTQHRARNQSIIIDLFYGQLKSKVSCLCCGKESVRFDPFSLLSLPLPVENYIYFEVLVILLDGSVPTKYGLRLNPESRYIELKRKLSSLCFLHPKFMLVCELSNSQVRDVLCDEQKINAISAKELYVYQLPEESDDHSHSSSIIGINIENGLEDIQRSSAMCFGADTILTKNATNIGQPHNGINITKNDIIEKHINYSPIVDKVQKNDNDNGMLNDNKVATKVRRCFGNTMCMPQNLLCFKHAPDMSTSPESTFVNGFRRTDPLPSKSFYTQRKSCHSLFNDISEENSMENSMNNALVLEPVNCTGGKKIGDCPCRCGPPGEAEMPARELRDDASYNDDKQSIVDSIFDGTETQRLNGELFTTRTTSSQQCKIGKYLLAVHRKITRQDTYFMSYHKTRPSLFGVPLLIPNCEGGTQKDLYCAVWLQVSRLLSPLPVAKDQSNHAADCDDSLGYNFPFTLRIVKRDGLNCAICPWSSFCRGCEIPCDNDILLQGKLLSRSKNTSDSTLDIATSQSLDIKNVSLAVNYEGITIAIDWDPTALHLRYQSTLERLWTEHKTLEICRKKQIEPIDLDHCLRAFTSEEKLEQWYHCSHCKGNKPATKKLQIWKLPPILIIHLKRFNCVNGKWVKSQKVVHFPFEDFDPTPYLASVPQETILRHKEIVELQNKSETTNVEPISRKVGNLTGISENESNNKLVIQSKSTSSNAEGQQTDSLLNNTKPTNDNLISLNRLSLDDCNNYDLPDSITEEDSQSNTEDNATIMRLDNLDINSTNFNTFNVCNDQGKKRRRLISTSLTKTPVVDGEFEDFHQHKLKNGEDYLDPKYKLYAVVSHSGMLNGGHYISYAANSSGSWHCYNDSSCREICNRPNLDPSSAYLLFYERRGLDYEPYLPNIEGKAAPTGENSNDSDDSENDLKKLCVIS